MNRPQTNRIIPVIQESNREAKEIILNPEYKGIQEIEQIELIEKPLIFNDEGQTKDEWERDLMKRQREEILGDSGEMIESLSWGFLKIMYCLILAIPWVIFFLLQSLSQLSFDMPVQEETRKPVSYNKPKIDIQTNVNVKGGGNVNISTNVNVK